MEDKKDKSADTIPYLLQEEPAAYGRNGFIYETEEERLLADINRSGIEKLQLFTKMLRREMMLKKFGK